MKIDQAKKRAAAIAAELMMLSPVLDISDEFDACKAFAVVIDPMGDASSFFDLLDNLDKAVLSETTFPAEKIGSDKFLGAVTEMTGSISVEILVDISTLSKKLAELDGKDGLAYLDMEPYFQIKLGGVQETKIHHSETACLMYFLSEKALERVYNSLVVWGS